MDNDPLRRRAVIYLGSLLGGTRRQSGSQNVGDLLGSLLGGAQPAQQNDTQGQDGLDLGDVLTAGMAFMNAKQQGQGTLEAGLAALMAAGPLDTRASSSAVWAGGGKRVAAGGRWNVQALTVAHPN